MGAERANAALGHLVRRVGRRGGDSRAAGPQRRCLLCGVPTHRRLGVASEAIGLATAWALQHLPIDAVVAVIDELNVASIAAARSAGFRLDGQAAPWEYDETGVMLRYVRPAGAPPNAS